MSTHLDVFAIRHAQPLEGSDPGVDPRQAREVDGVAWALSAISDGTTPEATVYTSPARRAIETAQRMLANANLTATHAEPIVSSALAEDAFLSESEHDASLRFISAIYDMARVALESTSAGSKPVLVLVTHEPTLRRLPHLKGGYVNTDPLGINQFSVEVS